MKVVEGSIWIPWICLVVIGILTVAFQWMEWGIIQGEMLTSSTDLISYVDKEEKREDIFKGELQKKIHFLKNGNWKLIEGKKEIQVDFSAGIHSFQKEKRMKKTMKIKQQHPIEKLRRRERLGEAVQKSGIS